MTEVFRVEKMPLRQRVIIALGNFIQSLQYLDLNVKRRLPFGAGTDPRPLGTKAHTATSVGSIPNQGFSVQSLEFQVRRESAAQRSSEQGLASYEGQSRLDTFYDRAQRSLDRLQESE